MQVTKTPVDPDAYEDPDELLAYDPYKNVSISERLVYLLPEALSELISRFPAFAGHSLAMLKSVFVQEVVASLENLSLLSDLYIAGHEMRDSFMEMLYVIVSVPRTVFNSLSYVIVP